MDAKQKNTTLIYTGLPAHKLQTSTLYKRPINLLQIFLPYNIIFLAFK